MGSKIDGGNQLPAHLWLQLSFHSDSGVDEGAQLIVLGRDLQAITAT